MRLLPMVVLIILAALAAFLSACADEGYYNPPAYQTYYEYPYSFHYINPGYSHRDYYDRAPYRYYGYTHHYSHRGHR